MTRNRNLVIGVAALLLACCEAAAANVVCPAASDIKQTGSSDEGTMYTATTAGNTWKGEVSKYDDDVDLATLHFEDAAIANAKKFVACDYFGAGRSNLRMTIDTTKPYAPANKSAWTEGEPAVCKSADVTQCEFN
jgi:hypothetical protein